MRSVRTTDRIVFFHPLHPLHSHRRATIGSIFVARRAGTKHASIATRASSSAIAMNVNGSVAPTPNSNPAINLVSANEAAKPIAMPMETSATPCLKMSFNTSPIGYFWKTRIGGIHFDSPLPGEVSTALRKALAPC
jgi:hypothetical protein